MLVFQNLLKHNNREMRKLHVEISIVCFVWFGSHFFFIFSLKCEQSLDPSVSILNLLLFFTCSFSSCVCMNKRCSMSVRQLQISDVSKCQGKTAHEKYIYYAHSILELILLKNKSDIHSSHLLASNACMESWHLLTLNDITIPLVLQKTAVFLTIGWNAGQCGELRSGQVDTNDLHFRVSSAGPRFPAA